MTKAIVIKITMTKTMMAKFIRIQDGVAQAFNGKA
jgi:hypothetical protein